MMTRIFAFCTVLMLLACNGSRENTVAPATGSDSIPIQNPEYSIKKFEGTKVPVLCYHAIRHVEKTDSPEQKTYSVSPEDFAAQMKALADNGFTTISPDQLRDFYSKGAPLPEKPVMITFDDGRKEQYSIAAKIMDEHQLKGVFFIMTVAMGKSRYMNREEISDLSSRGHIIGCHTWDHHKVTAYEGDDWKIQLQKPKMQLEKIVQKPVTAFAYPYGLWNRTAADSLKSFGYETAFTLYGKQDASVPLYTIERINVPYSMKIGKFIEIVNEAVSIEN